MEESDHMTPRKRPRGRRTVVKSIGVLALGTASISGTVSARGKGNATGNGGEANLIKARKTETGAIIATDDHFVISGQEIEIDDREFYSTDDGTFVIYNDGYTGQIRDNRVVVTDDWSTDSTFGIRVEGATVRVADNDIEGDGSLANQFLGIAYTGGAGGTIEDNRLENGHRVGIRADGEGTNPMIRDNSIGGVGPKTGGWAENGIQISRGASANVRNNTIEEVWWDTEDWESSGVMVFGASNANIQRNTIRNADAGVALFGGFGVEAGENNNLIHNDIEVTRASEIYHEGVFVMGDTNGIRQNEIRAAEGDVGILVHADANNTKLIRNRIDGWEESIVDDGEDTKLPRPFAPA